MNNETITINGLLDGISVVEKDNQNEQPFIPEDNIYNDQEPFCLNILNEKNKT